MQKLTTLIFDFDGVIADSGEIFAETLQEILKKPEPFTLAEVEAMRNSNTRQIIQLLGLKKWQVPFFAIKGKRGIAKRMHRVDTFEGMPEILSELHARGITLYIVSTNAEKAIQDILNKHDLAGCFNTIYAGSGIFTKAKRLRKLMRSESLQADECAYIGDETRDIDAAREVGVQAIAVAWGYNSTSALEAQKPDILVKHPEELLTLVPSSYRKKVKQKD